jgi:hypothetical protein
MLLGVHTAQFGEPLRVQISPSIERRGDTVKEGDEIEIPSSMATVVPAYRIIEMLQMPMFAVQREEREKQAKPDVTRPKTEVIEPIL